MKIKHLTKVHELDIKRCYLPIVVEVFCPSCYTKNKQDFLDDYLPYPHINGVEELHFYCDNCEHEWDVKVKLTVHLEEVKDEK